MDLKISDFHRKGAKTQSKSFEPHKAQKVTKNKISNFFCGFMCLMWFKLDFRFF